ncbi:MAG: CdaR family protein [Clostridiales bacterium]|nr:CdaR family protein [Clostridiales bacterium]
MENNGKHLLEKIGNSFKGALQKNWVLMVMSLVIGMLLWGYVLAYLNPVRLKRVPGVIISLEGISDLQARNLIVVNPDLGKATVTVSAEITKHAEIDATRVSCVANVNKITAAGVYNLPLDVRVQSDLGTAASWSPETVRVEVDRLITKAVPVQLAFEGELPEGYSISRESVEPSLLTLEGAARYIEPAFRAIATVDLTDLTHDFDAAVTVVCYDREGNELTVITRTGQEPSVIVRLGITAHRELPVRLDMTPPNEVYYETNYTLSLPTVTVWGDANVLWGLDAIYTEHVEITPDIWGTTFEIALVIPQDVTLKTGTPRIVKTTVTVEERIYEKTFTVPIKVENLPRGLTIADPNGLNGMVEVTVSGTKTLLDELTAADVLAVIDLTGLRAGTHTIVFTPRIDRRGFEELILVASPEKITLTLR